MGHIQLQRPYLKIICTHGNNPYGLRQNVQESIKMWQVIFSACLATKYLSIFVCPVTAVSCMLPNNYTHILQIKCSHGKSTVILCGSLPIFMFLNAIHEKVLFRNHLYQ